eukprot:5858224-Prymnesium_polylepis.1
MGACASSPGGEESLGVLLEKLRTGTDREKANAALGLGDLGAHPEMKVAIAYRGGIDSLVDLALLGSDEAKATAAYAIGNLAINAENQAM